MKVSKIESIIFNIAYISIFFMYFRIIPIDIETQPIVLLIMIPISFIFFIKFKKIKIKKQHLLLFFHLIISVIYILIGSFTNNINILSAIKFLIGPISYLIVLKNIKYINYKCVKTIIILLFVIFLLQFTNFPILSNIIRYIYDIFFIRWNSNFSLSRGLGVLVPEPSYFAYFSILLLYSLDYIKSKNQKIDNKEINMLKILVCVMSLITKSATVYIFLIIYLLQYIQFNSIKKIIFFILVIIIIFFTIQAFSTSRIEEVIVNMSTSIRSHSNILDVLFYSDASGGFRFLINYIYYLSIFINPFGFGLGGLQNRWNEVAQYFHINIWNNLHFRYMIDLNESLDAQSYMANAVGTFGILSIFLFIYIFIPKKLDSPWKKNIYITLIFFMIFYQSNLFNPVFWILIAMIKE